MINTATNEPDGKEALRRAEATCEWRLQFLRSPVEILPSGDGQRTAGIRLAVNRLEVSATGWDNRGCYSNNYKDMVLCSKLHFNF